MHPILRYLEAHGKTQAGFARRMGISKSFLSDVVHGRSFLGRKNSCKCVELTGGEVTLAELAIPQPAGARRTA